MARLRPLCRALVGITLLAALALALPAQAGDADPKPLDQFFKGHVKWYEKGVITLHYDFSDPAQLEDFFDGVPFPVRKRIPPTATVEAGRLVLKGSAGVRHTAAWTGDVSVKCQLRLDSTRNVGGMITPASKTNDFATFTVREFFFHAWDRGQKGGQHSIIKFGDQWRESDATEEYIGFRYIARKMPPKRLKEGETFPFAFGLKDEKLYMNLPKVKLKGKDLGVALDRFHPGLYSCRGGVTIDDLEIIGTLDEKWLRTHNVAPKLADAR